MRFTLDIKFFAYKKGVGSTKNGRDSHSKRLGAKLADGKKCHAGIRKCYPNRIIAHDTGTVFGGVMAEDS